MLLQLSEGERADAWRRYAARESEWRRGALRSRTERVCEEDEAQSVGNRHQLRVWAGRGVRGELLFGVRAEGASAGKGKVVCVLQRRGEQLHGAS